MFRRFTLLGLLAAASALAGGCCWRHHCGWYPGKRVHLRHANAVCSPSYSLPPTSAPIQGAPLFPALSAGPGCANCGPGPVPGPGYPAYDVGLAVAPPGLAVPPGTPVITGPTPLGGPSVEPPGGPGSQLHPPAQMKPAQ